MANKKLRPATPAVIPALTENAINIVEVRLSTPVGGAPSVHVRWEIGDDSGDGYVAIRQESGSFKAEELATTLGAPMAGGSGTPIERLHESLFELLAGRLPEGVVE